MFIIAFLQVTSFVTDNAANVSKMRQELEQDENVNLIAYGCSAHIFNLLAHDLTDKDKKLSSAKEQVMKIIKYFRNHQMPCAIYKELGGSALILPSEVRWNTMADSLESYLQNWPILCKVCEENREIIDKEIIKLIQKFDLKKNAEDLLKRLKETAVATDKAQQDTCGLSDVVSIWKNLEKEFETFKNNDVMGLVKERMNMALTPAHYLAFILDPRKKRNELNAGILNNDFQSHCILRYLLDETEIAMEFASKRCTNGMPQILSFKAQVEPFSRYLFSEDVLDKTHPLIWWKSIDSLAPQLLDLVTMLFSAVASSAGVERIFSTFGLVQSDIRNRLGTEKAGKLTFIYKMLN